MHPISQNSANLHVIFCAQLYVNSAETVDNTDRADKFMVDQLRRYLLVENMLWRGGNRNVSRHANKSPLAIGLRV